MLTAIAYDISNNTRRTKVQQVLKGYGRAVQKSVFECWMSTRQFAEVRRKLETIIDIREDSVLYYQLCSLCTAKRDFSGRNVVTYPVDGIVI